MRFFVGVPAEIVFDHINGSTIALMGTTILIVGLILCAVIPSFGYIYLTYGILTGQSYQ